MIKQKKSLTFNLNEGESMKKRNLLSNEAEETIKTVTNYHQKLIRKSRILLVLLGLAAVLSIAAIGQGFIGNNSYAKEKAGYIQQLTRLKQERAELESGEIPTATESFDDQIAENLANLEDFPLQEDFYTVTIKGTDSQLKIDRNNIFVSDNANILNTKTKREIYERNKELAAGTNGSQIEVVTVNELPAGEDIESYANTVFTQLGIGNKEENNGILYLIAVEDRKFRLEVGYGLEGLIPDGQADDLINNDEVIDAFKAENYSRGVSQVVNDVFQLINTKTAVVDAKIANVQEEQKTAAFLHWGYLVFLLSVLIFSIWTAIRMIFARSYTKQVYQSFLEKTAQGTFEDSAEKQLKKIKSTELYFLMLSGISFALSNTKLKNAIIRGKLLSNPKAQKLSMGRVLIGDTLYGSNGAILTSMYSTSSWSNSDSNGGGGGSWGSFGGGSSGGGGASGGW
jgi:uncharacterized protein